MVNGAERRVLARRAEGEFVQVGLANEDRARLAQPRDDRCIGPCNVGGQHTGGGGRGLACDVDEVFDRDRDAVERPAIHAVRELAGGPDGRGARALRIDPDECVGGWLESGDGREALLDEIGDLQLAGANPGCGLGNGL